MIEIKSDSVAGRVLFDPERQMFQVVPSNGIPVFDNWVPLFFEPLMKEEKEATKPSVDINTATEKMMDRLDELAKKLEI